MNGIDDIQYVLDNETERWYCITCEGVWIGFTHGTGTAFYRLSPIKPEECPVCALLDADISKDAKITVEREPHAQE